jgi:hypothetical protein
MGYFPPSAFAAGAGLYLFLVLSAGIGRLLFIAGFSAYRQYQLVQNIPEMPLRNIPMGVVRVQGKAQADELLLLLSEMPKSKFWLDPSTGWKGRHANNSEFVVRGVSGAVPCDAGNVGAEARNERGRPGSALARQGEH